MSREAGADWRGPSGDLCRRIEASRVMLFLSFDVSPAIAALTKMLSALTSPR